MDYYEKQEEWFLERECPRRRWRIYRVDNKLTKRFTRHSKRDDTKRSCIVDIQKD